MNTLRRLQIAGAVAFGVSLIGGNAWASSAIWVDQYMTEGQYCSYYGIACGGNYGGNYGYDGGHGGGGGYDNSATTQEELAYSNYLDSEIEGDPDLKAFVQALKNAGINSRLVMLAMFNMVQKGWYSQTASFVGADGVIVTIKLVVENGVTRFVVEKGGQTIPLFGGFDKLFKMMMMMVSPHYMCQNSPTANNMIVLCQALGIPINGGADGDDTTDE